MKVTVFRKQLLLIVAIFFVSAPGPSNGQQDPTSNGQQEPTDQQTACVTESAALNTNANVSAATQELMTTAKDEMLKDFYQFCRLVTLTCTADISTYSGTLRAACEAENGQLAERDIQLNCVTNVSSPVQIPGTVKLLNLPACVGASCDPNNLPPEMNQILDEVVSELNTEVNAALGNDVKCTVGSSASSRSPMFSFSYTWNILVGALSLVAFLSWSS